jgi:heptosyltransferase I
VGDRWRRAEPPKSVAIVMLSALGDAVHVLPVVTALERAWPQTRLTWIIQPVPHALVAGHPAVDEFLVFHRRRGAQAARSYRELYDQLRDRRFDLVINLQVYLKAGLITALLDADTKLGFDRRRARDFNWLFTTERIPARPTGHVQAQYFEFLEYLGIDPEPIDWQLTLSPAERAAQTEFFQGRGRSVAVVVGTSKTEKNWLPDRYARVIDALVKQHDLQPILVGGPSAIERELAAAIIRSTTVHVDQQLGDDVRKLVWLLDGADLVISPDTGPLHIARALNRPVIGLYGYTNPKRYGPYRAFTELIVDGYARFEGENYPLSARHRSGGMERVTVEMVLEKVELAVRRYLAGTAGVETTEQ